MKSVVFKVVLVALVLSTVTLGGCICCGGNFGGTTEKSPEAPEPTENVTPTEPASTSGPAIGDEMAVTFMSDLSQVRWYEYQITPSGTPVALMYPVTTERSAITVRWDFGTDYKGQPADKATGTVTYPGSGSDFTGICTAFLDHTDHARTLDGNITAYEDGKVLIKADITPNVLDLLTLLDLTKSTYTGQHTVTYGGVETVSVPYGTFETTKYLYNSTLDFTVYMNESVPIPVKVEAVSHEGSIYDVQLKSYEMIK